MKSSTRGASQICIILHDVLRCLTYVVAALYKKKIRPKMRCFTTVSRNVASVVSCHEAVITQIAPAPFFGKKGASFLSLQDNQSSPFETRIVRGHAGCSYTKRDNYFVHLPPSFSKQQCYLTITNLAGWKSAYNNNNKGKFKPIDK